VITNILISLYFFNKIGFIIIPIATTISSWINALLLLIYLTNKEYFLINLNFIKSFFKIASSTILTSYIFYNLINFFTENLTYSSKYKLITIILLVIVTFIIYILISIFTKAFKISDIKLKY
jgi:putative peptidoglycan lipid II flippase